MRIWLAFSLLFMLLSSNGYTAEATDLSALDNAALIKKTTTLFDANKAVQKTYKRAWAHNARYLKAMAKQRGQMLAVAALPPVLADAALAELEKQLETAKQRLSTLKGLPDLLQTERAAVNAQLERAEKAVSILESWISNVEQIDACRMEINLRIADGSLPKRRMPRFLSRASFIKNRQREYKRSIATWKQRKESMRKQLTKLTAAAEQVKQAVIDTELQVTDLSQRIAKNKQTESFKQGLAQKSDWQLLAMYQNIRAENEWETGAFLFDFNKFEQLNAERTKLEAAQAKTTPPAVEEIGQEAIVYNPEKAKAYAKSVAARKAYHTEEISQLKTLIELTEKLTAKQTNFAVKGSALRDQFAQLQVITTILKKRVAEQRLDAAKLPKAAESTELKRNAQYISEATATALGIIAKAKESLPALTERLTKSQVDLLSFQTKETTVRKALAHTKKREQQEVIFQKLDATALLEKMQTSVQSLSKLEQGLPQMRKQADKLQATVHNADFAWRSIKGPLFGIAAQEHKDVLREIQTRFYGVAEITLPEAAKDLEAATPLKDPTLMLQKWADNPEKPLSGLTEELQAYQRLLSNRIEFIDEGQQRRMALHVALGKEKGHLEKMTETLNEALTAARQSREGAVEIQKRLGRHQLTPDKAPADLEQRLNQTPLDALQKELSTLLQRKTWVEEQLTALDSAQSGEDTTPKQLNDLLGLVNSRLRILGDRAKLLTEYTRPFEKWSDTEKKNLTQGAIRRLEASNNWSEHSLGIFASERGNDLTEIIRDYYAEVIKLKSRLGNLKRQDKTVSRVLQLAENENAVIEGLLKAMQVWTTTIKEEKAQQETRLRMQLQPDKAADIQQHWEEETGKSIAIPVPFDTAKRQQLLDEGIKSLFETAVKLAAAQKWVALFKVRHSRLGIQSELAVYQGENGNIKAQQKSVQRQLHSHLGFPAADIQQIQVVEGALTPQEMNRLQLGGIGVIRIDRAKVQQNAALWAVGKFFIIIGIAILLIQGLEFFVWRRMEKQAQRPIPNLVKGMVSFIIYTVALFMIVAFVFGQTLTGLLATSGVLAMVIGLAIQMNISNIFSGLAINLEQPFQIGDRVKLNGIDGIRGAIENISWRSISLRDTWGNLVIIPNHTAAESIAINYTGTEAYNGQVWQGFKVFLSGEEDPDEMQELFRNAVRSCKAVTLEPYVLYFGFNEWAAEYGVYWFISYKKRWGPLIQINTNVWHELKKRGIKPKFKQIHSA